MGEVGQHGRLLAAVVEVATVRTVQPHVGGGAMAVVVHRPPAHSNARALIATVFLYHEKLRMHKQTSLYSQCFRFSWLGLNGPLSITDRRNNKSICDVTVSCTTDSYLEASSREAGAAAELVASNKVVKYAGLSSQGEFVPIAVESHGSINRDALQFLSELSSWRLVETTEDVRASSFLFQRISVVVQCFNSVLLHDGFVDDDRPE